MKCFLALLPFVVFAYPRDGHRYGYRDPRKSLSTRLPGWEKEPTWDDVQKLIDEHPVMMFSVSYCGFARQAKIQLDRLKVRYRL